MKIFLVYCHPSEDSFTARVRNAFIQGLVQSGHSYEISNLYKMNFNAEFKEKDYLREAYYREDLSLDSDVIEEQKKIQSCDGIVFIYPVFWTEAPAKLVGWFDRVRTCGFAYGSNPKMKLLEKALFIVVTGRSLDDLRSIGQEDACLFAIPIGINI